MEELGKLELKIEQKIESLNNLVKTEFNDSYSIIKVAAQNETLTAILFRMLMVNPYYRVSICKTPADFASEITLKENFTAPYENSFNPITEDRYNAQDSFLCGLINNSDYLKLGSTFIKVFDDEGNDISSVTKCPSFRISHSYCVLIETHEWGSKNSKLLDRTYITIAIYNPNKK